MSTIHSVIGLSTHIVLIFCMFYTFTAKGEDSSRKFIADTGRVSSPIFAAYLELAGSAQSFGSINLEVFLWKFQRESLLHSLRFSAGIGASEPGNGYIPILLKGLFFDSDHHFELGIGCDVLWKRVVASTGSPYKNYSDSPVNPIAVIGYRYEKRNGGILFRAGFTPMYDIGYSELVSLVGVSIGFAI